MDPAAAIPGFTAEQQAMIFASIEEFKASFQALLNEAFDKRLGRLPPLQPPVQIQPLQSFVPLRVQQATQITQQSIPPAPQAQKEEDEQQALVKRNTAAAASHDSKQLCRKWTPHTGLLATFLATSFLASFGSFFGSASFLASHGSQFGYIRCMEEMEASGEG
ncbi:hypothetical protein BDR22DRAFT_889379 [Usnea florida]